jgi:type II secretory pathway pseudopilin PulG
MKDTRVSERPAVPPPHKDSAERGISLVELLIGVAISCLLLVSFFSIYSSSQQYVANQNTQSNVVEETRLTLDGMANDIRQAVGILQTWTSYTSSSNTIILTLPCLDAGGIIVDDLTYVDYVVYRLTEDKIEKIVDSDDSVSFRGDSRRFVAENINALSFRYFLDTGVEIFANLNEAEFMDIDVQSVENELGRVFNHILQTRIKLRKGNAD